MSWPMFDVITDPEKFKTIKDYMESPTETDNHSFSVTVTKTQNFSEDYPGICTISLRNISKVSLRTMFGVTPPFSRYKGKTQNGDSMVLIPLNSRSSIINAERLLPEEPPWRISESFTIPQTGTVKTLEPGDSVSDDYAILLPEDSDSEYKSGKYLFSDQIKYERPSQEQLKNKFEWSFEMEIVSQ